MSDIAIFNNEDKVRLVLKQYLDETKLDTLYVYSPKLLAVITKQLFNLNLLDISKQQLNSFLYSYDREMRYSSAMAPNGHKRYNVKSSKLNTTEMFNCIKHNINSHLYG